jgi:hypothetical protein
MTMSERGKLGTNVDGKDAIDAVATRMMREQERREDLVNDRK